MLDNFVTATYIVSGLLFILALQGLSKHESAKRGNALGVLGMILALVATNFYMGWTDIKGDGADLVAVALLVAAVGAGAAIGIRKALKVEMTGMPELIALLHSFVGLAAVLVGWNGYLHVEGDARTRPREDRPGRELDVVARSAHRDSQLRADDADLQWFLHRERVRSAPDGPA